MKIQFMSNNSNGKLSGTNQEEVMYEKEGCSKILLQTGSYLGLQKITAAKPTGHTITRGATE